LSFPALTASRATMGIPTGFVLKEQPVGAIGSHRRGSLLLHGRSGLAHWPPITPRARMHLEFGPFVCKLSSIYEDAGLREGGSWRAEFYDADRGLPHASFRGLAELAPP
jgi:hypothetical protein